MEHLLGMSRFARMPAAKGRTITSTTTVAAIAAIAAACHLSVHAFPIIARSPVLRACLVKVRVRWSWLYTEGLSIALFALGVLRKLRKLPCKNSLSSA